MQQYYFIKKKHRKERKQRELQQPRTAYHEIFDWLDSVLIAIVAVILVFSFIFRVVNIDGSSMESNFYDGEKVIISNIAYTPARGDVVIISRNFENNNTFISGDDDPIIKRVIAVAGDTIQINESEAKRTGDNSKTKVLLNGTALNETYIDSGNFTVSHDSTLNESNEYTLTVPVGYIFVMGDNRKVSMDSRFNTLMKSYDKYLSSDYVDTATHYTGLVKTDYVLGEALIRVYPFSRFGGVN